MIAILDFGGQYAHLISTRLRSFGVFTSIFDPEVDINALKKFKGIVLSGGPQSVFDKNSPHLDAKIFDLKVPILAICYGHQLICQMLGGKVVPGTKPEYGPAELIINLKNNSQLLAKIDSKSRVWMSHNDEVEIIPEGFEIIASTVNCKIAVIENMAKQIYGLQFHPEVVHTKEGNKILENFVDICQQKNTWNLNDFIDVITKKIKAQVGNNKVFLMVSGGVDSTVAFALLEKALGKENVFGAFIDTGMLRLNERKYVAKSLEQAGFANLHVEDASDLFLSRLEKISDPEEKRRIIGDTFLDVQKELVQRFNLNPDTWLLGQGTIYPDTIESGSTKNADTIKTHHNRVPEIQKLIELGKIVEPIADLYKDEVRELGKKLGLPAELVSRHPFPGPGLGVRILCQESDNNYDNKIYSATNYQYQILPIKSVGVQGDGRTYKHPALIYINNSPINWDELESIAVNLVNNSKQINRVVLSLSHLEPINLVLKPAYLSRNRVKKLQLADQVAHKLLFAYEKAENPVFKVWQFPVVLLPLYNDKDEETIVLRPIFSQEAMTAEFARLPQDLLTNMTNQILKIDGIGTVLYDITHKPPATIEWE